MTKCTFDHWSSGRCYLSSDMGAFLYSVLVAGLLDFSSAALVWQIQQCDLTYNQMHMLMSFKYRNHCFFCQWATNGHAILLAATL